MEHSLTVVIAAIAVVFCLNPYSNGTLSDNLSKSTLRLFLFHLFEQLHPLNQRVNPFRMIFSQI